MSTFTENYDLIKPDKADYYDVADFNENMDTIDTVMSETEALANDISDKIGTPSENSHTLFSLLESTNEPHSIVKSIQHITFGNSVNSTTTTGRIQSVDPSKSFVIYACLTGSLDITYVLEEDQIVVTHKSITSYSNTWDFWIIEFN